MSKTFELGSDTVHYAWNNAIEPRLTVDQGDVVTFHTRDAGDGYYTQDTTNEDVANKGPMMGHPLTGPVYIRGATPGDVMTIEVLGMELASPFGWTVVRPGRGLLPAEELPGAYIQKWDLSDGKFARMQQRKDIAVPIAAFPGIMGTALAEEGDHTTMPPRKNGGNMDNKHLTVGSTLYLPVFVEGGLFSTGDAHAAQGDGESCITAVETWSRATLRFGLIEQKKFEEPRLRTNGPICQSTNIGPYYATTAQGPDLLSNAQQAIRYMIDHLMTERGLSWHEAYVICSVAVDLKISEIVDVPNLLISAFLPECIFVD